MHGTDRPQLSLARLPFRFLSISLTVLISIECMSGDTKLYKFQPDTKQVLEDYLSSNAVCFDLIPIKVWPRIPQPITSTQANYAQDLWPERVIARFNCIDTDYLSDPKLPLYPPLPPGDVEAAEDFYISCPGLLDFRHYAGWEQWTLKRPRIRVWSTSPMYAGSAYAWSMTLTQALCIDRYTHAKRILHGTLRQCIDIPYTWFHRYVLYGRPYQVVAWVEYEEIPRGRKHRYGGGPEVPYIDILPLLEDKAEMKRRTVRAENVSGINLPHEFVVEETDYMACTTVQKKQELVLYVAVELLGNEKLPTWHDRRMRRPCCREKPEMPCCISEGEDMCCM